MAKILRPIIDKMKSSLRVMDDSGSDNKKTARLLPLTPKYVDDEHKVYVHAIETALNDKQILNIALSGHYGVGKSSILREVARRHEGRSIELSLSTLAPIQKSELDDSVPLQAATSTNQIQQEIVKQLLYRLEPTKARGSRFRRIERFRPWRELAVATLLGLILAVIFLLTGWSSQIETVLLPIADIGLWIHIAVLAIAIALIWLLRNLTHGQLQIKQFSAGSATVTLDDSSVSYFDQYLDEIVYFFEISEQDIVIFEDIDRFNDSYIFETLRALNTLLNSSPQIKKPVRFIYATKDSIFDRDRIQAEEEGRQIEPAPADDYDPALAEVMRANRTKFFDLVIPVVPFITHRSARDLVDQLLCEIDHDIDSKLIDLTAKFVPDMRLLINIRNEFMLFRGRIFSGAGENLSLNETQLFAMMLYKNTHLADFEAIRLGKSNLDKLYDLSRKLVTENIARIESEQIATREEMSHLDSIEKRSEKLGERLISFLQTTAKAIWPNETGDRFSYLNQILSLDDLKSPDFWEQFTLSSTETSLVWQNSYGRSIALRRETLATLLDDPLDPKHWSSADHADLKEDIRKQSADTEFLRSADMGDLIGRPGFLVKVKDKSLSFEAAANNLIGSGLAYQLVRHGYIDRTFTLYTSTYHSDRMSSAATNFSILHIDRDKMDVHYKLSPGDVDAIISENGEDALVEPALFNIDILDHLLSEHEERADVMIGALATPGERQSSFIQSYLSGGKDPSKFIERFTLESSEVFTYLVNNAEIDGDLRLQLMSTALANLDDSKTYNVDKNVSEYLRDNYSGLPVLTDNEIKPIQADRIATLFGRAGIILPSLDPVAEKTRQSFIARNLFEISRSNLAHVLDQKSSLSLNSIRDYDKSVYDYVLDNLGKYLSEIRGVSPSVDSPERFISILTDVHQRDPETIDEVIEVATPDCVVLDLENAPDEAFTALARFKRFPATVANIQHYIETVGDIDDNLAVLLTSAGRIDEAFKTDEDINQNLAVNILSAQEVLSSPQLRADLVSSLSPDSELPVQIIPAEEGELFSLLLRNGNIPDDAATYEHLHETNWKTRESLIRASANFENYMIPAHVGSDLAALMKSNKVNRSIKTSIAERAIEFMAAADRNGIIELARYADNQSLSLPIDTIQSMAQEGIPAPLVVSLLQPNIENVDIQALSEILIELDGDFPELTVPGKIQPKIPNSPANIALLDRLKIDGVVSNYSQENSSIRVYRKHG